MIKKLLILILLALFLPTVIAINLDVQKQNPNEVSIVGLENPTTFNLEITNNGKTDEFRFYNLFGFTMEPTGRFKIESNETKNIELIVYPRESFSKKGYFVLEYFIKDTNEIKQAEKITIKFVELEDSKYTLAENLSSGMQRRLDIACSLINNPKVLIMDEPTQDLDPVLRKEIANLIKRINENGTTVILTSHLLFEAEVLCDEIAILHQGKILEMGTPDQLKAMYSKNQEIHLKTSPGRYDLILKGLRGDKSISHVQHKGHKIIIFTPKAEHVLKRLLAVVARCGEELVDVDLRKPSLNEVFESLVAKK